ncbi:c-type cytochrome biogenesis protein CcmI [Tropicimonas isoalkanivorans]|uniref:Cytochrome c-type biogenesis protein CcmH n=1 Tax=Tropicimonas isoalkanivorans TaxID=441112 RepID=A0A1I1EI53_9RHOB|nr:c-type cytochrome biogenesis protein CcmI [Tropicimonas isoalkanivorans]SFB86346.1 cytochrome c-type biogenesis protein CcmH [Tropicimonas isoalkanivorans]
MLFWSLIAATSLLAGLWLARPFLRGGHVDMDASDGAMSVYRDQIEELERDHAAGLISAEERDQARQEIERRALVAARRMDGGLSVSRRSPAIAASLAALAALTALGGYALTGVPTEPDRPLASRRAETLERMAAAGDVNSRIALLIDKTSANPTSFEDWWTLAQSYSAIGNHSASVDAYRKAVELSGDRPAVLSAYAEAMTLANGNKVPDAARLAFEQVLNRGPDVRARYYIALAKAQAQDFDAALEDWTALVRDSQPDAPWMPLVRRDIVNMVRFLNADVTEYLPDASPQEIASAGGALVPAESASQIADLERSLADDPHDYKGWIELATLRAGNGENEAAANALAEARSSYAGAPFVLQKIDEAARRLGLDLLPPAVEPAGPSQADIEAAADMSEGERDDMIEGMVAGLAAKLEDAPNNPDGWIMLVRSYAVMGQDEKARDAISRAEAHFADSTPVLERLRAEAATVLTE